MSSLLNTYGDKNNVTRQGKTQRVTCETAGDPIVVITGDLSSSMEYETAQWYRMTCTSTAQFSYVGMTYDAASRCRDAMIKKFTRTKQVWQYVEEVTKTNVYFGWKAQGQGTVQEAEISLNPVGGHMYNVDVAVNCEDIKYAKDPSGTTFSYPACMSDLK